MLKYRLCDYPAHISGLRGGPSQQLRCSAHRDYGTATLIFEDGRPLRYWGPVPDIGSTADTPVVITAEVCRECLDGASEVCQRCARGGAVSARGVRFRVPAVLS